MSVSDAHSFIWVMSRQLCTAESFVPLLSSFTLSGVSEVEVVLELLGMMHMLTSFADILHAQCMRMPKWPQQILCT